MRSIALGLLVATLASCGGSALRVIPPPPSSSTTTPTLSGPQRARRIVEMQRDLGVDMHYSLPKLGSALATDEPVPCLRADDDEFHRSELATAYRMYRETPDHWTRVEAGYIAGACPTRLRMFFASLTRLGHAEVASSVTAKLRRLGVST